MIDTVLNLLLRCPHKRLTRPMTQVNRSGKPIGGTYVVCLACGKQFSYDPKEMRMGKAIPSVHEVRAAEPKKPKGKKLKYAFWASIPLAVAIGSSWKGKSKPTDKPSETEGPPQS